MIQALLTYSDSQGLDLDLFKSEADALYAMKDKVMDNFEAYQRQLPPDFETLDVQGLKDLLSDEDSDLQFEIMPLFVPTQQLHASQGGVTYVIPAPTVSLAD